VELIAFDLRGHVAITFRWLTARLPPASGDARPT
jgi:hypothetical protein